MGGGGGGWHLLHIVTFLVLFFFKYEIYPLQNLDISKPREIF